MLKLINKVPAGTFLVPLIISMVLYTFWPDLFKVGGFTEAMFSSAGVNLISGLLAFATGSRINIQILKRLLKHQGALLLVKIVIATILSFAFLALFGHQGIWGISGVAFVAAMFSVNPAMQLSILEEYGYEEDGMIIGLSTSVTLPILPMIIYSTLFSAEGLAGINWSPILSTLFPLVIGFILGNIDPAFGKLFGPLVGALLPFLGWNLGQSMNFMEALKSGGAGILVTVVFLLAMSVLYIADTKWLKHDGLSAFAMMSVAGVSTIVAPTIAHVFPEIEPFVTSASSQILFASIITSLLIPFVIGKKYKKVEISK